MIWKDTDGFLETIKEQNRYGIFLDMGVGKTSLLLALADYKFFNGVKKILIITPKKVSLSTWQNEIKKWKNFNYMESIVSLIEGTEDERIALLKKTGEFCIHIISSSLTEWLYGKRAKGKGFYSPISYSFAPSYDLIIVDECSQFKSPKSLRFKALKKLVDGKSLFLLSGTPFSNIKRESYYYTNADELYYLMYFLELYDKSLTQFRTEFCFTQVWNPYRWLIHNEIYDKLIAQINTKSIRKKLSIEPKIIAHVITCEKDEARFQKLKRDYIVETANLKNITASNQAIMINKALQLSNGFIYDEMNQVHRINHYKFEKLKDLLSTLDDNVIIFYNFKEDRDYLLKNIPNATCLENKEDIERWNNKQIKVLIMSPFSEKYGLNLQEGGHTIIWFGLVWSAESYGQANARLYRRGQTQDVNIYYLLSKNSFDAYVYDILVRKTATIDSFISHIQE